MSYLILLLLLCLSLHACNARPLCLFYCKGKVQSNLLTEGVDSANYFRKVWNPSELQKKGPVDIKNNGGEVDHRDRASTLQQNFMKEKVVGYKIIISSHNDLQQNQDKVKGLIIKRQARSMLGNRSGDDTEEAVDSKENDTVEDIVVMDYAQPHRKPPIHNEKH
ncbi:uncharacterized protein LOC110826141 [Carica papaya]|uniref:uncharacterized protein LOC110826141 n=1 Tax=Carica papaya TaxID=3649 RepID=UPI000B8CDB4B|nr:uncharacterized protein LOC110826141 [Carica papaya]